MKTGFKATYQQGNAERLRLCKYLQSAYNRYSQSWALDKVKESMGVFYWFNKALANFSFILKWRNLYRFYFWDVGRVFNNAGSTAGLLTSTEKIRLDVLFNTTSDLWRMATLNLMASAASLSSRPGAAVGSSHMAAPYCIDVSY